MVQKLYRKPNKSHLRNSIKTSINSNLNSKSLEEGTSRRTKLEVGRHLPQSVWNEKSEQQETKEQQEHAATEQDGGANDL